MPKTKEELNELKEEYQKLTKQVQGLSEEELENVTGGCTTYGDGYDGVVRPIVTIGNSCGGFMKATYTDHFTNISAICKNCKFYSYNVPEFQKGIRITAISGWCTMRTC